MYRSIEDIEDHIKGEKQKINLALQEFALDINALESIEYSLENTQEKIDLQESIDNIQVLLSEMLELLIESDSCGNL